MEANSISRSIMLDSLNYAYMKARMRDFALGEEYLNSKLVCKVLRSLAKRFIIQVTIIKEAKDIDTMRTNELIGPLQTFEIIFLVQNFNEENLEYTNGT
ncbi:hypothetical protein PVK06_011048 [Gossypium arboreum]|uniref:Gag-pol polyprotein n=1 Tax=Gossypium arboreum TaxID=29729 RepID=A0ABR0Q7T1_GOSAR|nr:hypothetical protein PVK06_011048 [Gossypium arboreum]